MATDFVVVGRIPKISISPGFRVLASASEEFLRSCAGIAEDPRWYSLALRAAEVIMAQLQPIPLYLEVIKIFYDFPERTDLCLCAEAVIVDPGSGKKESVSRGVPCQLDDEEAFLSELAVGLRAQIFGAGYVMRIRRERMAGVVEEFDRLFSPQRFVTFHPGPDRRVNDRTRDLLARSGIGIEEGGRNGEAPWIRAGGIVCTGEDQIVNYALHPHEES